MRFRPSYYSDATADSTELEVAESSDKKNVQDYVSMFAPGLASALAAAKDARVKAGENSAKIVSLEAQMAAGGSGKALASISTFISSLTGGTSSSVSGELARLKAIQSSLDEIADEAEAAAKLMVLTRAGVAGVAVAATGIGFMFAWNLYQKGRVIKRQADSPSGDQE